MRFKMQDSKFKMLRLLGLLICVICATCGLSFAQTAAPVALAFPDGVVGTAEATAAVVFTNSSAATLASLTVSIGTPTNSGTMTDTTNPVTNCGASLAAGSACTITVTFTPGALGASFANMTIAWTGGSLLVPIYGSGVNTLMPAYGPAGQPIIYPAATVALTTSQCGSLVLMGATTGEVVTLPATPALGCPFDFVIMVTNTSNYNEIQTGAASPYLGGEVQECATGIACLDFFATATSTEALKMAGTGSSGVTGGYIGSHFHVAAVSATVWEFSGVDICAATCTTAFTNSE